LIHINGNRFSDESNRTLILRGVNLGGSSKVPTSPDGDTRFAASLQNPGGVSFIGRPFPLEEADEHFARLKKWGFTFLRFLITWEAVEHSGPGIYDQAYLDYLFAVVKKANDHEISLFIDPHQDVWSRFNGGDGAPAWTFEAANMDWTHFVGTGAAVLEYASGNFYPPLIWGTNGIKLAGATMFTLFFAGNDFAPQVKANGEPIQDYLQGHYIEAMRQVALRLKDLPNVFGFDTLNEPNNGYIGWKDLARPVAIARMGFNPSPFQSMLLGDGIPQELDFWKPAMPKAKSIEKRIVNPERLRAWKDGVDCIWKRHGVWDLGPDGAPRLLKPEYFTRVNGRPVDFNQDYLRPFANRYAAAIRTVMPRAAIFVESMPGLPAPRWSESDAREIVHAPHWYDLYHIITNDFSPWIAIDAKTSKLVFGPKRIRKAFAEHMAAVKAEAQENLGDAPTHIGEFGISFDIKNKRAFQTGDFRVQAQVMDRTFRALEDNLLSCTIWDYTADNTNTAKDKWNAQDYSIFSRDQQADPANIHSGGRALEAVIRPYAQKVAGEPLRMSFDIASRRFEFEFHHDPQVSAPTEIYLPDFQYPYGCSVTVSDGSYTLEPGSQTLVYRHSNSVSVHRLEIQPRERGN
jgi:hypothetical protein